MNCPWARIQVNSLISVSVMRGWCPRKAMLTGQCHSGAVKSVTQCLDNASSHSPGCPNTSCDMDGGKRVCLDSFSEEQDSSFPLVLKPFFLVLFFSLSFSFFFPVFPEGAHPNGPMSCVCHAAVSCWAAISWQQAVGERWLRWPLCHRVCTMPWELWERMGMMYTGDIPGVITHHRKSLDCSGPINFLHSSPLESTVESNFKHLDHTEYINTCILAGCNNSMISMTPWWMNRISQAYFIFQMGQSWVFFWISTLIFS